MICRCILLVVAALVLFDHSAAGHDPASADHHKSPGVVINVDANGAETPWPRANSDVVVVAVNLRVEAFDRSFQLSLRESATPSNVTIVQRLGRDGVLRTETSGTRCMVYDTKEATNDVEEAAVSICLPMVGYFFTNDFVYLIEPLRLANGALFNPSFNVSRLGVVVTRHESSSANFTALPRERRSTETTSATIKLLVVVDPLSYGHFQKQAEPYAVAVTRIARSLIRAISTKENRVDLVLTRLIIMEFNDTQLTVSSDMMKTLELFCDYQNRLRRKENASHLADYDMAILLSRQPWPSFGGAWSRSICNPQKSCSVIFANGLGAAFSIAHNLGIALGLRKDNHDSHNDMCSESSGDYGIMAERHGDGNDPWTWSSCSRQAMARILSQRNVTVPCLSDEARGDEIELGRKLPGRAYSLHEQCELVLGPGAKSCPKRSPSCETLWCRKHPDAHCVTDGLPWADGTRCGVGKHCHRGKCTIEGADGRFGPWSDWGPCSRSCGGGVAAAMRRCDQPRPTFGGRDCEGAQMKYTPCNIRRCPAGDDDFREKQCAVFDGTTLGFDELRYRAPTSIRWIPVYKKKLESQCKLFCSTDDGAVSFVSPPDVVDGTPCRPDLPTGICAGGQCKLAGCDGAFGSGKELDVCGVCGGSSSTCYRVTGRLSQIDEGFKLAFIAPKGSASIRTKWNVSDGHYLVVKNSSGHAILNGSDLKRFVVFKAGGAWWKYDRKSDGLESLVCLARLDEPVQIEIHKRGDGKEAVGDERASFEKSGDTLLSWEYYAPLVNPRFTWTYAGEWTSCSKDCQGTQFQELKCIRIQDRQIMAPERCNHLPTSAEKRTQKSCNTHCSYTWGFVDLGQCSVTCGVGVQRASVMCIRTSGLAPGLVVSDARCDALERPSSRIQPCIVRPCTVKIWRTGRFGECSSLCGFGDRIRSVECVEVDESSVSESDLTCDQPEPPRSKRCRGHECTPEGNASSCAEWKSRKYAQDMEYTLEKNGRLFRVYCHGMAGKFPCEYLTLPSGEKRNYARVFPYYLEKHHFCPHDVTDERLYKNQLYSERGASFFFKVRLLIDVLEIQTDDLTFATSNGSRPEFASAGDCFSQQPCPQGTFHVDLTGTGFELASVDQWKQTGHFEYNHMRIDYRAGGYVVVRGFCGGFCGRCFVPSHRLKLRFFR